MSLSGRQQAHDIREVLSSIPQLGTTPGSVAGRTNISDHTLLQFPDVEANMANAEAYHNCRCGLNSIYVGYDGGQALFISNK